MSEIQSRSVKNVFTFYENGEDFCLSVDFVNALNKSLNPFIIMFIGNYRAGKSTRLNQIVSGQINSTMPFRSNGGKDHITIGFQFLGPISIAQLGEIYGINLSVQHNPDIFLIDCEGLSNLGKSNLT
jgi:hypothetical protein